MEILQAEKHQNLSQWEVIPLLVLDIWEQAYYLKYQTQLHRFEGISISSDNVIASVLRRAEDNAGLYEPTLLYCFLTKMYPKGKQKAENF